jgi:hypothetical protein
LRLVRLGMERSMGVVMEKRRTEKKQEMDDRETKRKLEKLTRRRNQDRH